jgi:hypothetical protein
MEVSINNERTNDKMFELTKELKITNEKKILLEAELKVLKLQNNKLFNDYMNDYHSNKHTISNLNLKYSILLKEKQSIENIIDEHKNLKKKYDDMINILTNKYNNLYILYTKLKEQYNNEINTTKKLENTINKLNRKLNIIINKKYEITDLIDNIYTKKIE